MRQSRGSKVEARPCEAEARPSQLKSCLEAASTRGRCLEDYIPAINNEVQSTTDCFHCRVGEHNSNNRIERMFRNSADNTGGLG